MSRPVARYREFAASDDLRDYIRAFFSFSDPERDDALPDRRVVVDKLFRAGESFCSPLFADGHVSLVFNFENSCQLDGTWRPAEAAPRADVIGAMSAVGIATMGERADMVGVYFRAAQSGHFLSIPAAELSDQVVPLQELWGCCASAALAQLAEQKTHSRRIQFLERFLVQRIRVARTPHTSLDLPALADCVGRSHGHVSVEDLADAAGVSRQYLTRVFREHVGVTPKVYCRLVRFQSGLKYGGRGEKVDWAQAALELGYSDQSHMIAEFRQFSSLTPQSLASGQWFHPFIERARSRAITMPARVSGAL